MTAQVTDGGVLPATGVPPAGPATPAPAPVPVPSPPAPTWQGVVIVGTAVVLGITILASLIFICWNVSILSGIIAEHKADKAVFAFTSMGLLGQISLRILGIYFGAAAMLAGTATAFYSIGDKISASGDGLGGQLKFALASASPGIAAVFAGALVICVSVGTEFKSTYSGETVNESVGARPKQGKALVFPDADTVLAGKPTTETPKQDLPQTK